jgi:hypothetical protein
MPVDYYFKFAEDTAVQLANANLSGAKIVQRAVGTDGTAYALARLSNSDAAKFTSGVIENEASADMRNLKPWMPLI